MRADAAGAKDSSTLSAHRFAHGDAEVPRGERLGCVRGGVEALADKHSQLDGNLQRVDIRILQTGMAVELNGLVTLTVHMRDLTDDE